MTHPFFIRRTLACARQQLALSRLFLSFEPDTDGPAWEYRPFRRWLILRTDTPDDVLAGMGAALLACSADLGRGPCTAIPPALLDRHRALVSELRRHVGEVLPGMQGERECH
jgi:hypothetical protein